MKKRLDTNDWRTVLYANPVVLVSTRSPAGVDNVAPYGMCMPISMDPPMFAIGVKPTRHTCQYIKRRGEFGINFLGPALKQACVLSAEEISPELSEFDHAGLGRFPAAEIDVALVAESPANMECRLEWMHAAGDHDVMVGRIVAIWVDDAVLREDPVQTRLAMANFYRISDRYFRRGLQIS
jgi:flavin reductase (DIM6/NTAB) family NADH-FMN oxidoreductase RutF